MSNGDDTRRCDKDRIRLGPVFCEGVEVKRPERPYDEEQPGEPNKKPYYVEKPRTVLRLVHR